MATTCGVEDCTEALTWIQLASEESESGEQRSNQIMVLLGATRRRAATLCVVDTLMFFGLAGVSVIEARQQPQPSGWPDCHSLCQ